MDNKILQMKVINKYKDVALQMLQLSFPSLSVEELNDAVDYSIIKRMKNGDAYINNNYKNKQINSTVLEIAEYILEQEPIITSYGVMFNKHNRAKNPLAKMIEGFLTSRKVYKKEMFNYPKGSEMFEKYNLLQLLSKIDANGTYGVLGMHTSIYYNLYVAASITTQGRSCISSAALLFEAFLSNNVPFLSLDEIITFIHNVINEDRKYNDSEMLDRDITLEEAFYKIMTSCGGYGDFIYVPTEEECVIVWEIMMNLKQEDLNRLFYKNNLYNFMDNASMSRAVVYILQKLDTPYLDPNSVPKEIKVELEEFWEILKEYVYYGHQIIDRLDKMENLVRNVCIIMDTDSSIISLDAWYRYVLDKVYDVPMKIKTQLIDPIDFHEVDEFGEMALIKPIEFVEQRLDYDFYSDELIDMEKSINPCVIIPQENVRYSIINIMAYCISQMVNDYMMRYTKQSNSYSDGKPCLLNMKNEFLFRRALTIPTAKKHYATIQELQEGNVVPEKKSLDVKGIEALTKSTMNETTRNNLRKILYEDILKAPTISQIQILKDLAIAEKKIYNSIQSGKKEYYKPVKIKSLSAYETPMRIQGIKAAIAYNYIRDENLEAIDLEKRNSIDIIKVEINEKTVQCIRETYPTTYERICDLLKQREFDGDIDAIALPLNVQVPKWLLNFVDYTRIINDNLSGFPLGSVGLYRGSANNNYTNIVSL